jgi:hypothetical protein
MIGVRKWRLRIIMASWARVSRQQFYRIQSLWKRMRSLLIYMRHFISEFSHTVNTCIYVSVILTMFSMKTAIYFDNYNWSKYISPKYWHCRTLASPLYHSYLDWLFQFQTDSKIFSTYVKVIHIFHMKGIHPKIVVLKYLIGKSLITIWT